MKWLRSGEKYCYKDYKKTRKEETRIRKEKRKVNNDLKTEQRSCREIAKRLHACRKQNEKQTKTLDIRSEDQIKHFKGLLNKVEELKRGWGFTKIGQQQVKQRL